MTDETLEVISDTITDSLGRVIKLKEITGKSRVAFYRALGAEDCQIKPIMAEYWNIMAVDEFDGRKQGVIKSKVDLEFMASELEKSNANELISDWIIQKMEEKERIEKEAMHSLKK